MNFAKVYSAQIVGLSGTIIDIEADIAKGLHSFSIVGLPDKAVEESRDRVSAAIKNSGFTSPKKKNQKVCISLAPAHVKKEGAHFDLGIALAYLLACDEISFDPARRLFLGELSLDGNLRPIRGTLPLALAARAAGFKELYVPEENAAEAALGSGLAVYPVRTLSQLIGHLSPDEDGKGEEHETIAPVSKKVSLPEVPHFEHDFRDIKGQKAAKRALIIAASGGHNIALYGPPGTGKTMLAQAFPSILPPLRDDETLEVTGIHSIAGTLEGLAVRAPFRSPHHTASYAAIVGGGSNPRPGEITLAHRGVLFLDEFPEFDRRVIEALRQPLENGNISISRSKGTETFPARFILLAAMNPCPCGNFGSGIECTCTPIALERYRKKLSGPIVDRIDLWIEVSQVEHSKLARKGESEITSIDIRKDVTRARERQRERFKNHPNIHTNAEVGARQLLEAFTLAPSAHTLIDSAGERLNLSGRAYHRVIKVAQTIADLEESSRIEEPHILEALQYRPKL